MIMAIFFYGIIIINDPELKIPFGTNYIIEPHFGWSYYLTLFTGLGCVILGCFIWALDFFVPRKIAIVFHRTTLEDDVFFEEPEPEQEQQSTLEEYGVSVRGVRKTQRGLTRFRQTQRKPRTTLRSQGGNQQFRNEAAIPLEDMPRGATTVTVSTKT